MVNTKPPLSDDYYTAEQVAEKLRIHRSQVWRMCRRGELAHVKIGRLIRVPSSEFEKWLKQSLKASTT